MSAERVQVLEDLLARVNKNRVAPGLRLALAHEAARVPPSAPITSRGDAEPPSTKDFGERDEEVAAAQASTLELGTAEQAPVVADEPPSIAVEEAADIVLDEASQDVFIEEEPTSPQPPEIEIDVASAADAAVALEDEPPAVTQAEPLGAAAEREARELAVAAANREPATQPRPEPSSDRSLVLDEPTADAEPTAARAATGALSAAAVPDDDDDDDDRPTPVPERAATAAVTQVLDPPTGDPDAITSKQPAKAGEPTDVATAQVARRPPPLPATTTVISETQETELETPAPPAAAPAIAARQAIKPVVITPQVLETAKVAEMIGEISALKGADFGVIIDATLSLGFKS